MLIGPRAAGKTTTVGRRAKTTIKLDDVGRAVAFQAAPDAALRGFDEPVLLDEWQAVPAVLGAVRRAIDEDPSPNRFYLTGSVLADHEHEVYPGTGRIQRIVMYPMTVREQLRATDGPTFFDGLAEGTPLSAPQDPLDLRGYVELAVRGGFPMAALHLDGGARELWLENYVSDLLTRDVEQLGAGRRGPGVDQGRLQAYFEACALNSAGIVDHKRIYDAAGIRRETGEAYDQLLGRLFAVEQLPTWSSNRLKRLTRRPKRYLIDPAMVPAALRLDEAGILADGELLGRLLDTFVAAQLRAEVAGSATRPRLHHLRTKGGRQEIDLLAELGGERLIAIEVKASAAPTKADATSLAWLRDEVGDRFLAGVVLHTGPQVYPLGEKIQAAPIASLWSWSGSGSAGGLPHPVAGRPLLLQGGKPRGGQSPLDLLPLARGAHAWG